MERFLIRMVISCLIGSLIGWGTNRLAIAMLFRPTKPKKLLFFHLQGVLPRRQPALAESIGEIVSADFISMPEIMDMLINDRQIDQIKNRLKRKIHEAIREKIPGTIYIMFGLAINTRVDSYIDVEGHKMLLQMIEQVKHSAEEHVDIRKIVEDKINALDFSKFEQIVLKIAKKELRFIEIIGAALGFCIGLAQGFLFMIY